MVKRIFYALVVVIAAIAIVNDVGRWIAVRYSLTEATNEAARLAADATSAKSAWERVSSYAEAEEMTVYGFEWTEKSTSVWTEKHVPGTWALGPVMIVFEGQPVTGEWKIRDEASRDR